MSPSPPLRISTKRNVTVQLGLEHAYYGIVLQLVNHYTMKTEFIARCLRHPKNKECRRNEAVFVAAFSLSLKNFLSTQMFNGQELFVIYGISTFVGNLMPNPNF